MPEVTMKSGFADNPNILQVLSRIKVKLIAN